MSTGDQAMLAQRLMLSLSHTVDHARAVRLGIDERGLALAYLDQIREAVLTR